MKKLLFLVPLGVFLATEVGASNLPDLSFEERVACHLAVQAVLEDQRTRFQADSKRSSSQLLPAAEALASRILDHPEIEEVGVLAELDRILGDTKDPATLSLMLQALGDDPGLAAECIARPALVKRGETETTAPLAMGITAADIFAAHPKLGSLSGSDVQCADDTWTLTSIMAGTPTERSGAGAVWTGVEMVVWGGQDLLGKPQLPNTGGVYVPATDSWSPTSTDGAPAGRTGGLKMFWTGSKVLIWGGNVWDGGLYDPVQDSWNPVSNTEAPSERSLFSAVWTGTEMIVWGGRNGTLYLSDGARYSPAGDSWLAVPDQGSPSARYLHSAVWSGSQMIIWGGLDSAPVTDGGLYDPVAGNWSDVTSVGAPSGTVGRSSTWTGREMLIWDGTSGGRYSPEANSWQPFSTVNAPSLGSFFQEVWNGWEWLIWGTDSNDPSVHEPGGRYSPKTDEWVPMATAGSPDDRWATTAVWTGRQAIFWGGSNIDWPNSNVGGLYCAKSPVFEDGFESGDTTWWTVDMQP